jgi:hypothetical protein
MWTNSVCARHCYRFAVRLFLNTLNFPGEQLGLFLVCKALFSWGICVFSSAILLFSKMVVPAHICPLAVCSFTFATLFQIFIGFLGFYKIPADLLIFFFFF